MNNSLSLRGRLTLVILLPLIAIAAIFGAWAYRDAQANTAERFDRSLLSTALAISRDTAVSGGDLLSEETRDLLRDTSGGAVFYHVYAPDGVFVTGYATPPVPPKPVPLGATQTYYDAIYQGADVRALRYSQSTTIDGLTGIFTLTVWQDTVVRDGFVQSRTGPLFLIIASLIGALALVVWFGVRRGLSPLLDLEDAIARRSTSDLTPIQRRIPPEVNGIVNRFNNLLHEVSQSFDTKNAFISDAAHQLRNPIAGVQSLAESVANAKTLEDAKERSADLLLAAKETSQLTNNLLTLEKIQGFSQQGIEKTFDPIAILNSIAVWAEDSAANNGVSFDADIPHDAQPLQGDATMFEQAILNLVNNALTHGGTTLTHIALTALQTTTALEVTVSDDGKGIDPEDFDRALGRFSQIGPSAGSGLGLPIAKTVVESFQGHIALSNNAGIFAATLTFPTTQPTA